MKWRIDKLCSFSHCSTLDGSKVKIGSTVREMVSHAFANLKPNRNGHSVSAIRNHIKNVFGQVITKRTNTSIRKVLADEFAEGRIRMTNDESDDILFTKRFALVK